MARRAAHARGGRQRHRGRAGRVAGGGVGRLRGHRRDRDGGDREGRRRRRGRDRGQSAQDLGACRCPGRGGCRDRGPGRPRRGDRRPRRTAHLVGCLGGDGRRRTRAARRAAGAGGDAAQCRAIGTAAVVRGGPGRPSLRQPAGSQDREGPGPLDRGHPGHRATGSHPAARRGRVAGVPDRAPGRCSLGRPRPAPDAVPGAAYDEVPHSRIRLATARRLVESKQTVPHFYLRATVRADALLALRAEINEESAEQISINDLVVKAVAGAHRRVPEMNVTWSEDAVRRYRSVDVAVAVATERGLLTPVVRDVGALTVTALSATVRELARAGPRGPAEAAGARGRHDLGHQPGDVRRRGVRRDHQPAARGHPRRRSGAREPVVEDGAVVPGQVMTLTLSVDHRPVDGVLAARWMAQLVALLQHPVRLVA